jgi:hypothetical protein
MTAPTLLDAVLALVCGGVGALLGGALGGIATGGKALGNQLAAFMGAFYGPLAGFTGVAAGLVVLAIIT